MVELLLGVITYIT